MNKIAVIVLFTFGLAFSSCDNFFSKSWGNPREYDPAKIDVTLDNLDDWLDQAVGNPELYAALEKKIEQEMKKYPKGSKERAKMLEGGVKAAVGSSGLGEYLLTQAMNALSGDLDEDSIMDILKSLQDYFNSGGGPEAAAAIAAMVGENLYYDENGAPHLDPAYADIASPADVAEAILVLVLGELGNIDDDWSNIDGLDINGGIVTVGENASPGVVALAAYLNLISEDTSGKFSDNPLTGALNDAFFN